MKKADFCACLGALRQYSQWEQKMYGLDIDLVNTPIGLVVEHLIGAMREFNMDWSYDTKLGFDWIIEWACSPDGPDYIQTRHGRTWDLRTASVLYDFLVFMNEHGWED